MIHRNILFIAAAVIAMACLSSASAEIIQTSDAAYGQGCYPCSSTDLINDGSPALLSESRDTDCWFASGVYTVPWANDGIIPTEGTDGEWYNIDFSDAHNLPVTLTFMLDTSTNTNGYDITEVDSFSGWTSTWNKIAHQSFALEMSKVGDDTWSSLGVYTWAPFSETVQVATSLYVLLTDNSGGVLDTGTFTATNIDGIRLTYLDPGNTNEPIDGTILQEIDVYGTPSTTAVPEPSTFVLLVSSVLGLLAYGWRKRN